MTKLDHALALAKIGFWVFPVEEDGKRPALKGWQAWATRDPGVIGPHWEDNPNHNIGVFAGKFGDYHDNGFKTGWDALIVVDVDNKKGKNGNASITRLEIQGYDFPDTLTVETPNGGTHLFYRVEAAVKQGADILGEGLDVRSRGGYVLGIGSTLGGKPYVLRQDFPVCPSPKWLVDRLSDSRGSLNGDERTKKDEDVVAPAAAVRGRRWLASEAPLAIEGQHGDETTYVVSAKLKDMGCDVDTAYELMSLYWNARCVPPWAPDELQRKVVNAYRYGQEAIGSKSPEKEFTVIDSDAATVPGAARSRSYLQEMNDEYALISIRGKACIMREKKDVLGMPDREFCDVASFKLWHLPNTVQDGKRTLTYAESWLEWSNRREYPEGITFCPEQDAPAGYFNLWRGFYVEPVRYEDATPEARRGYDLWLEHIERNVTKGDAKHAKWVIGWFAHMAQRPWEKPRVALVLKGRKGVGKNVPVEIVGHLVRSHRMIAASKRFLTGNFNSHLDGCLYLILDEAFWSGDKEADGILKNLVTGEEHVIERKGYEPYKVKNLTRVIVLGNEKWLVPATEEERRYAVFEIGEDRMQDKEFFGQMIDGMKAGGYSVLLHKLREFDLSSVDLERVPETQALLDQKTETFDPLLQWWLECLQDGMLVGADFGGVWPAEASCDRLRDAFLRFAKDGNIKGRLPNSRAIGRRLKLMAPGMDRQRCRDGDARVYRYTMPELWECRLDFEKFVRQKIKWGD